MNNEDFQRCSDLWFDDGNIVLQAEQTLFQVYKGVLRRESPVFADMLSLSGQPEEHYGKVPLVRMHDTAEEIKLFLSVIFIHQFMDSRRANPELATIMAVSAKYQAPEVHRRAQALLTLEFPSTLKDYDALRTSPARSSVCQTESDFWALTIAVIKAARRTKENVLLPAAFLRAASHEVTSILAQDALDLEDRIVILAGRDKLSQMARKEPWAVVFSHGFGCGEWGNGCRGEWGRVRDAIEVSTNFIDPFCTVSPPVDRGKLCSQSRAYLLNTHPKAREDAWERLPIMFGLSPWAELVKESA
ncbi:hypothetical protein PsYK624_093230 [Phanerochaete sordida]|uniref:BTB domain-containing protein n=1 Tax=Phanerochaete sordida TaxID=48140 RepID=A0A9P3GF27_9APHY|nr:hypothetical protein PsYK624_093230 [Phanerochaete sordida]